MKIFRVNQICIQEKRNVVVMKTLYFMFDGETTSLLLYIKYLVYISLQHYLPLAFDKKIVKSSYVRCLT